MEPHSVSYATPSPAQPNETRANGLGIASLILGIIACLGSFVPFCGLIPTLFFGIIGIILGLVGLLAAKSDKRTGVGFPIAGVLTCATAIVVGLVITFLFAAAAANSANQAQQRIQQQQRQSPGGR
jgi:membrane-bound ClpP family serine protease